jgi:hypothetical protein
LGTMTSVNHSDRFSGKVLINLTEFRNCRPVSHSLSHGNACAQPTRRRSTPRFNRRADAGLRLARANFVRRVLFRRGGMAYTLSASHGAPEGEAQEPGRFRFRARLTVTKVRRMGGIPLRPDPLAWRAMQRRSFTRAAAALVMTHRRDTSPQDVLKRMPADRIIKAIDISGDGIFGLAA